MLGSYAMKSLFKAIRVTWLCLWLSIATIILGIPVMIAGMLSRTGNLAFSISKIWAYIILAVSFVRTEIKNKAKLLKGTSYIIISNHQSHFDILALVTTLGIQFRWIIKKVEGARYPEKLEQMTGRYKKALNKQMSVLRFGLTANAEARLPFA
jgi:hypothetical protein